MLDYHVHSAFSLAADSSMEEYCKAAVEKGMSGLAFTDHVDVNYPDKEFDFQIDVEKYSAAIERVRAKYPELAIARGIEAGYRRDAIAETTDYIARLKPDFVINSLHCIGDIDPYNLEFFDGKTRKEAYDEYIEYLTASLDAPYPYSVIGHIGYVSKRSPYPHPAIHLSDYRSALDGILYRLIYSGKGIELNTSSIRHTDSPMPAYSILKQYKQMGGEIITFGSDAHNVRDLMQHLSYARDMLLNAGFKYICGFKNMIPTFKPL